MAEVYATRAELWDLIGSGQTVPDAQEDRLDMCLIAATRWVQFRCGVDVGADDDELTAPYTLTVIATTPARKAATLAAATRFYKAPDVPFGVTGMGEYGMSVKSAIPEAELLLLGQREDFGFA